MAVNMQVHFTARGNFAQLQTALRQVNRSTTAAFGPGMGRGINQNVVDPLNRVVTAGTKANLSLRDTGFALRNVGAIARRSNALMAASGDVMYNIAGNAKVAVNSTGALAGTAASLGQQFRIANTIIHQSGASMVKWGKNMQWAGRQITVGLTVPLALLATQAIKTAEEYNKQMTRVIKVTEFAAKSGTETWDMELGILENRINKVADTAASAFGVVAAESTKAMAEFAQMGFRGGGLEEITNQTIQLAQVSGTAIPDAIQLSRILVQAFGTDISDLNEQYARMNVIENNTALAINEMAQSVPIVASVAKNLGMTAQETTALIAIQKELGISAKEAATALRTGLIRVVSEATDPAIEAFGKIGVSLEDLQKKHAGNTLGFLTELGELMQGIEPGTEAMDNFIAALGKLTGVRTAARFTAMVQELPGMFEEGSIAARAFRGELEDTTVVQRIYAEETERWQQSAAGQAEILRASINNELRKIGEPLLEVANNVRRAVLGVLEWFNGLDDGTKKLTMTILGFVAAIGPVGMLLGIMTNAFGQILMLITSFLPKQAAATLQSAAQKIAFDSTTVAVNRQTASVAGLTAALGGLASAQATTAATGAIGATGSYVKAAAPVAAGATQAAGTAGFGAIGAAGAAGIQGPMNLLATGAKSAMKFLLPIKGIIAGITAATATWAATFASTGSAMNATFAVLRAGIAGLVSATGIGAILLLIAAIVAISLDWKAVWEGFMAGIKPAIDGIKNAFAGLLNGVRRMFGTFSESGADMAEVSRMIGEAIGKFIGGAINIVTRIIERFGPTIMAAVAFVMNLVNAFKAFMNGDIEEGFKFLWEAIKNGAQVAIDFVLGKLAILVEFMRGIPWLGEKIGDGFDFIWEKTRLVNHELSNQYSLMSQINDLTKQRGELEERVNGFIKEATDVEEMLISAGAIKNGWTIANVRNNQNLTAEQKGQLEGLVRIRQITRQIAELNAEIARITAAQAKAQDESTFTRLQSELFAAEKRLDRISNSADRLIDKSRVVDSVVESWSEGYDDAMDGLGGVKDATDKAGDAAKEAQRKQQEWLGALRSSMQSVMNDIVKAVTDTLDAQRTAIERNFDRLEERAKEAGEREEKRIERNKDRQLAAIDAQIKRLEDAEKKREEFFRREKLRLDYFNNRAQGNINIKSALARGDFDTAAIERERLFYDEQRYISDLNQETSKSAHERKMEELKAKRETVQESAKLEAERTKVVREENAKRLKNERETALAAHAERRRLIERDLENWKRVTPKTQAEFNKHMGKLNGILRKGGVSMEAVTRQFARNSGTELRNGFRTGVERARADLAENRKWQAAGSSAGKAAAAGFRSSMAKGVNALATDVRRALNTQAIYGQKAGANPNPFVPTQGLAGRGQNVYMHSGGPVDARGVPIQRAGLKADEEPRILQHGEYVVQKKAVNAMGVDYFEALNNMKMHSGGIVNYRKSTIKDIGSLLGPVAGSAMGALPTAMAATLVGNATGKLAKERGKGGDDSAARLGRGSIKQVSDIFKAFKDRFAQGSMSGGIGGSAGSAGGGWPPRQWARLSPNTKAAADFARSRWSWPHGIGFGTDRGVAASDHSWGKAADFMVSRLGTMPNHAQLRKGWEVANYFDKNPRRFGTKYNIFDKMIKRPGEARWRPYTRYGNNPGPTLGHYDHVHTSFMHDGGLVKPPGMRVGGMVNYDNTIANLHKKETVLTAPLSESLKQGIKNMESGNIGGDTINITINASDTMDVNTLADAVVKKIDHSKRRKGRDRRVTTS